MKLFTALCLFHMVFSAVQCEELMQPPQAIEAVIFDCDGTLVDSENSHFLSWKQALNDLGGDLTRDDYRHLVGNSSQVVSQRLAVKLGRDNADQIREIKRGYFEKLCEAGLPPISTTVEFLKLLGEQKDLLGIQIGVCSAGRREFIMTHLKHLQVDHLLDIVLSGQDELHDYDDPEGVNKPKPYIYLHAIKELGVSPEKTIVIEDSAAGVMAGVSAGCFTIAIPNEHTKDQDLSHAILRLDSFEKMSIPEFFSLQK